MNIKPRGDRILVKPIEMEKETDGGILLPPNAREKLSMGEIVSVGGGILLDSGTIFPIKDIKPGDKVFYEKGCGIEMSFEDDVVLLRDDEVVAIVK